MTATDLAAAWQKYKESDEVTQPLHLIKAPPPNQLMPTPIYEQLFIELLQKEGTKKWKPI